MSKITVAKLMEKITEVFTGLSEEEFIEEFNNITGNILTVDDVDWEE